MLGVELYDYQREAVSQLRLNMERRIRNQVLSAPTGSGKTVMGAYLINAAKENGSRAAFVVDRISLVNQTSEAFDRFGIDHGIIQGDNQRYRPDLPVQIISAQTVLRREWPQGLDLIVVDECHSFHQAVKEKIARRTSWTVGLTATPFSEGLGTYYDAVVSVTSTHRLIEDGKLAPYEIYAPSEPDMEGASTDRGEWTRVEAEDRSLPIVGDCVAEYLDKAQGRKFIAFANTVRHAEELQRQFLGAGVQTEVYSYRGGGGEKAEMIEEFRREDTHLQGLISVQALAKGFDVESVSCVIIARPLRKSLTEHVQMIGRGLRRDPMDPEKRCIILDHSGNTTRFWPELERFWEEGASELPDGDHKASKKRDKDDEDRHRKCLKCHRVHSVRPTCPACGYEYPTREVIHEAGSLERMADSQANDYEERRQVYAEMRGYVRDRGWKPAAAAARYKEKYGAWPPKTWNGDPIQDCGPDVHNWMVSQTIRYVKGKKRRG